MDKFFLVSLLSLLIVAAHRAAAGSMMCDNISILEELKNMDIEEETEAELSDIPSWRSERGGKVLVNVDSFGAAGNGESDDTEAFQKAWNVACSTPKSVLLVPQGRRYLVNATKFKGPCADKLIIQIDGTLVAPDDPKNWDPKLPRVWLDFSKLNKAVFQGSGVIDGSGSKWWAASCKKNKSNPCRGAPTALTIESSSAIKVTGLTIQNSQQMHFTISRCDSVRIYGVKVSAPGDSPNTDGIHISESTNVIVQDCKIGTGDDCISIVNASSNIKMKRIHCGPGHGISFYIQSSEAKMPLNIFGGQKIKGTVVLMQKNVLDINSIISAEKIADGIFDGVTSIFDTLTSFLGRSISLQLISATQADSSGKGKLGNAAYVDAIINNLPTLGASQNACSVSFDYDSSFGIPGAFYIKNYMSTEFLLVSVTLEDIPNHGTIHFVCNSWIYNAKKYTSDRIFFANDTYLPSKTPAPLVYYRQQELKTLRGDGTGERQEWDRIYDYDVYNDLGEPDKSASLARPVLGGSSTFPYPRRGRTGRKPTATDPQTESRSSSFYIPRDEAFGHLKSSDFLTYGLKSISQDVIPALQSVFDINFTPNEFDSFGDVYDLYEGGIQLPTDILSKISPLPVLKEVFRTDGEQFLKFPPPKVIQVTKSDWNTDEEFAREIIAGVNPGLVHILQEFPPKSKLDSGVYGDHTSTITKEQIELNLDGLTTDQAIQNKKLFLLDHHDTIIPYLRLINSTTTKAYASRTILFLKSDGTLKPVAIELSLPNPQGDQYGVVSNVYLPAAEGVESSIWLLAKAYVIVNDSCFHQLVSHWLNTHAVVEPFVIATNRQLSVIHPIYKLLFPHYRDTMNINALARSALVNAEGIIEKTFLWGKYAMEMSSVVYKDWVFTDQALPADLIKRGIAVEDPSAPHGLRLVIEDYPYAVDGLDIWAAIKTWVQEYVYLYYPSDDAIQQDSELQAWWKELVEVGHGDKKNEPWWPKMQTRAELIESSTTLIWTASALHAAVNFGQYPYGGLILNRPTLSRRFMPEKGTAEYDELVTNTQKAYLRTITPKLQTLIDLSVIEILSRHASDEYYLGQRDSAEYWTSDANAIAAFKKFGTTLADIEAQLTVRNNNETLRNRVGPVSMPYTLLYPTSEEGLTFRGIPNSVSI